MANSAFTHEPSFNIPGSTTDNAVIRWDGTSGAGQLNSGIIIDDSNVITGVTSLTVDNLNVNGNTVISTDTNGNITFAPNGSGSVVADTVGNSEMSFNGTVLDIKNNGTQSSIKLYCETGNAHYQEIRGGPHSGATSYTMVLPHVPPTANQVLTTASISSNVAVLDWADAAGGGTTINGTTDNAIITYINSSGEFQAESTLKYDGAGTFTLANAATAQSLDVTTTGTAVTARIQLTSGATGTDGGTSLHFIEGAGNGAANNQQYFMGYRPGDNLFRFFSNSAGGLSSGGNIFTIPDAANNISFTGNLVMASSKGIDFSATANSSGTMANELLDDYEEGTFTPTLLASFGGASGSVTSYSTQVGRYTKIGNRVIFNLRMTVSDIGNLSGNIKVGGLPFTSVNVGDAEAPAFVGLALSLNITAGQSISGWVGQDGTDIFLQLWDDAAGTSYLQASEYSTGGVLNVGGAYETAS